jgi:hypothetical protein
MKKIIFAKYDSMLKHQKRKMIKKIVSLSHQIKRERKMQEKKKKRNRSVAMLKKFTRKYWKRLKLGLLEDNQSSHSMR